MKIKKGVDVKGLKEPMRRVIYYCEKLFLIAGVDFVITDAVAQRKGRSLHPYGYAIDVRTRELPPMKIKLIRMMLEELLGKDYDIIQYEATEDSPGHFHIEYQRFLDDGQIMTITPGMVQEVE